MRQLGIAGGLRVVKYVYEVTKKGMYIETEYQIDPNLFPSGAYPHGDGEWQKIRSQVLPVTTDEEFLNWLDYNNTGHEYDPTLFKMTGGGLGAESLGMRRSSKASTLGGRMTK